MSRAASPRTGLTSGSPWGLLGGALYATLLAVIVAVESPGPHQMWDRIRAHRARTPPPFPERSSHA